METAQSKIREKGQKSANPHNNDKSRSQMTEPSKVPIYPSYTLNAPITVDEAKRRRYLHTWRETQLESNESILRTVNTRCISIHQFQYQTKAQYKSWVRAHNRNIKAHGLGLEGFFYDPTEGLVNMTAACRAIQGAIDEGKHGLGLGKTHGHDFPHLGRKPDPVDNNDDWDSFLYTNQDL